MVKENVIKLNELKGFAYNNKKEFINAGIDLDDVYKQIDTFADMAMKKETLEKLREYFCIKN